MSEASQGGAACPDPNQLGLYIHVPFCVRKCSYCDFYSLPGRIDLLPAYVEAILTEARAYPGLVFDTVYLGGGTPSLLGPIHFADLVGGLRQIFDLSHATEFTLEANPDSLTAPLLKNARSMGVNRLSIGVQSLSDIELQRVGRVHAARDAVSAIDLARQEGVVNLSCDVILGLPGQDWSSLRTTLETLIALDIRHVSAYCLSLEPNTPLGLRPPLDLPDEDNQATLYERASCLLKERNYSHYEISNFAWRGYECRHNLNYWRGGEYLGLGPAAASHLSGHRFKNQASLDAYLRDPGGAKSETECLPTALKAAEEAMLRLRLLDEGLDIVEMEDRFGRSAVAPLRQRLDALEGRGFLNRRDNRYKLGPQYALVSNSILAEVLGD